MPQKHRMGFDLPVDTARPATVAGATTLAVAGSAAPDIHARSFQV